MVQFYKRLLGRLLNKVGKGGRIVGKKFRRAGLWLVLEEFREELTTEGTEILHGGHGAEIGIVKKIFLSLRRVLSELKLTHKNIGVRY